MSRFISSLLVLGGVQACHMEMTSRGWWGPQCVHKDLCGMQPMAKFTPGVFETLADLLKNGWSWPFATDDTKIKLQEYTTQQSMSWWYETECKVSWENVYECKCQKVGEPKFWDGHQMTEPVDLSDIGRRLKELHYGDDTTTPTSYPIFVPPGDWSGEDFYG